MSTDAHEKPPRKGGCRQDWPPHKTMWIGGHQAGGVLVVDMKDASDIPRLAEPWFLTFNATVEFRVAMTPEDLGRAGLDELGKTWG